MHECICVHVLWNNEWTLRGSHRWKPGIQINLLEAFMDLANYSDRDLRWQVIIHLVFIFSGLLLAAMDYIAANTKNRY